MADLNYRSITLVERASRRYPEIERWYYEAGRVEILVTRESGGDYRALARIAPDSVTETSIRLGVGAHPTADRAITAAFEAFVANTEASRTLPPRRVPKEVRDTEIDAMRTLAVQVAGL